MSSDIRRHSCKPLMIFLQELKLNCPSSVYSLFSALIMHVYQMRSSVPSIVAATQERLRVCMDALKEVSKVWLVAKMVHTLFESILGNKVLEERLQKAAGKRHSKAKLNPTATQRRDEPPKRKYDDMELGFTNGPPAPQLSYERSRPQTPAVTPARELSHPAPMPSMAAPAISSPHIRHSNDAFMGGGSSRGNTRPPTPFNPSYSIPATPPDLFLVTRNSPPISQSLWENFQPDQLFPDGTNMSLPHFSPPGPQIDPQLQMPHLHAPNLQQQNQQQMSGQQQLPQRTMRGSQDNGLSNVQNVQMQGLPTQSVWATQYSDDQSPDDSWSNSSRGQGPIVPTTLNVEDWWVLILDRVLLYELCLITLFHRFQFFGINGLGGVNSETLV